MPRIPADAPVLRAAGRWKDQCLLNDGSVLSDKSLWTSENVGHLVKHFVENPVSPFPMRLWNWRMRSTKVRCIRGRPMVPTSSLPNPRSG